jgi:hypothetical protein
MNSVAGGVLHQVRIMRPASHVFALLTVVVAAVSCSDATAGNTIALLVTDRTELPIGVGESIQLHAFAFALSGERIDDLTGVEWKSGNTAVVTVDQEGTVHGVALGGPVAVTASKDDHQATVHVTVTPASVVIAPRDTTLPAGTLVQLTAKAFDAAGNQLDAGVATWSITSTTIAGAAAVAQNGTFNAIAPAFVHVEAAMRGKTSAVQIGIPGPYDGIWTGTDALGYPVRIVVEYGSVTSFAMPNVVLTDCTTRQYSATLAAPIANGQFTAALLQPSGAVTGAFTPAALTGTRGAVFLGVFACDNRIQTNPYTLDAAAFMASR